MSARSCAPERSIDALTGTATACTEIDRNAPSCCRLNYMSRASSNLAGNVLATAARQRKARSGASAGTCGRKAPSAIPRSPLSSLPPLPNSGSRRLIRDTASPMVQNGCVGTRSPRHGPVGAAPPGRPAAARSRGLRRRACPWHFQDRPWPRARTRRVRAATAASASPRRRASACGWPAGAATSRPVRAQPGPPSRRRSAVGGSAPGPTASRAVPRTPRPTAPAR